MKQWQEEIYKLYTEGKQFEAGKHHTRFGGTAKEMRERGHSVPSRDAMLFISNLLERIGIFSEEETDSVVKNFNAAERRLVFLSLLDAHSEEIKDRSSDIDEIYESELEKYTKVEARNRGASGREEKYQTNVTARELQQQHKQQLQDLKQQATGSAADALNVISSGLDEAEQEMVGSLKSSYEEDTTIIEIIVGSPNQITKVVNFIKPYVGDSEIETFNDRVEVSAGPNTDLARLVAKVGRRKVENTINDWLDDNVYKSGTTVITPPDEPGAAADLVSARRPAASLEEPASKGGDEDEYGSDIPEMPEMSDEGDAREFYREPKRDIGDEDEFAGDEGYTPKWAQEEEEGYDDEEDDDYYNQRYKDTYGDEDDDNEDEDDDEGYDDYEGRPLKGYKPKWANEENEDHPGSRKSPEEGEYDLDYDKEAFDKADLDDNKKLSEYERKRSQAINKAMKNEKEENNENIKMSPQQMNQWMYMQRAQRMQNNLRQNERWGNY